MSVSAGGLQCSRVWRWIKALRGCEGFCRRTHAGHPIQLLVRASSGEARHECIGSNSAKSSAANSRRLLSGGKHASRKLKRAPILLAADVGTSEEEIARSVVVSGSTVYRTKRRFAEGNLERALSEEPRPGRNANSRARKKPCLWRQPAPVRQRAPCPLDAQAAGGCDGQAHRTQEQVARDRRICSSKAALCDWQWRVLLTGARIPIEPRSGPNDHCQKRSRETERSRDDTLSRERRLFVRSVLCLLERSLRNLDINPANRGKQQ
ncbi:hypothetical protein ACVIGB_000336 [Bradyrhizobium sp. USDA 4341]